jgi:hypothetical protein
MEPTLMTHAGANKDLREELSSYFTEQINVQQQIHTTLQSISHTLYDNAQLTAPFPPLSAAAFKMLNVLAQVRVQLLAKHWHDKLRGAQLAQSLKDSTSALSKHMSAADLRGALQIPYLAQALDALLAPGPLAGALADRTCTDDEYRAYVRDRLLLLTRLELAVMRYIADGHCESEPTSNAGEQR